MLKRGKRTKQWLRIKRLIKPRFEHAGITYCEFYYEGCNRNWFLTWAHSDKRRFLNDWQLENEVALACLSCHQKLERMSRQAMRLEVLRVISNRTCQPN